MDSAHPDKIKLLTLNEAAKKLAVSVEVLLKWNEHNILKPTITLQGEIGYTQNQLDQFLAIRQVIQDTGTMHRAPTAPQTNPIQTGIILQLNRIWRGDRSGKI